MPTTAVRAELQFGPRRPAVPAHRCRLCRAFLAAVATGATVPIAMLNIDPAKSLINDLAYMFGRRRYLAPRSPG